MSASRLTKKQKVLLAAGKTQEWDITLLAHVLHSKFVHVDAKRQKDFVVENKKILILASLRNDFAHRPSPELEDEEFRKVWQQMAEILVFFGENAIELEKLKQTPVSKR
jgi:hypothetical protein